MKYFFLFLALFITLASRSQTWQRLIDNPFNFGGANAFGIRLMDDTLYVSSAFVITDTISNTRAVISKHSLSDGTGFEFQQYKTDTLENSLFNELSTGYNQLYETHDSLLYMSLNVWNDDIDSLNKPHLLLIDKALNIQSSFPVSSYISDDLYFNFNGTRIDYDGNILLYGSRSWNGQYFWGDSANTLLVKMSPQGEQLWTKRYEDCYTINFLTPLADGDIILNAGEVGTLGSKKYLIKTNSEGEEQWRRRFGGVYTSPLSAVIETSSGKILAANSWNYSSSNEPGVGWWYDTWIQLQLIDDQGTTYAIEEDVKWAPTTSIQDVYGVEEMENGNFLTWGIIYSTTGVRDTVLNVLDRPYTRGFLFMVDEALDSLWLRTYYFPDNTNDLECYSTFRISDVAPLPDGGFATCGWGEIHGQNDLHKVWLMRLDEHGCLEPGCNTVAVNEIVVGFENSMLVYPNPVRDFCTLAWSLEDAGSIEKNFNSTELIITDTQGREVYRAPIPNFGQNHQMQLDVSSYSSGLYYAHWVSGSTWLDTVSIVVE